MQRSRSTKSLKTVWEEEEEEEGVAAAQQGEDEWERSQCRSGHFISLIHTVLSFSRNIPPLGPHARQREVCTG